MPGEVKTKAEMMRYTGPVIAMSLLPEGWQGPTDAALPSNRGRISRA